MNEVVWSRFFSVLCGSSAKSAALVLCAFIAGFGVGAIVGGKNYRFFPPVMIFILFQILLGLIGLFSPFISEFLYGWLPAIGKANFPLIGILSMRFIFTFGLAFIPAVFMGATIPLIMAFTPSIFKASIRGAILIASNTSGGALGALLSGYMVLPVHGVVFSGGLAGMSNIISGIIVLGGYFFLEKKQKQVLEESGEKQILKILKDILGEHLWVILFSFSAGFFLLSMEILWRRILVLCFGHDVYGMSAMLLWVITCTAIGGFMGTVLLGIFPGKAINMAGVNMVLSAIFSPLMVALVLYYLVEGSGEIFGSGSVLSTTTSLYAGIMRQITISFAVVSPGAFFIGAVLPLLCHTLEFSKKNSLTLASILLANNAGGLIGGILSAFFLVGLLGIWGSILFQSIFLLVMGTIAIIYKFHGKLRLGVSGFSICVVIGILLLPRDFPEKLFIKTAGGKFLKPLFYKEGNTSTVGVTRDPLDGERQLLINGVNEVSTRFVHDQSFAMLGHLGMLLHHFPRDVLVISYGAGISLSSAITHSPGHVVVVDLEKDVFPASKWFSDLNGDVLSKKWIKKVIEDGRFYLVSTSSMFDVIIVDSTHPRSIDSWLLYTREFYVTSKNKLKKNGIIVQWLPLHGMSLNEFKIIVKTFLNVFPEAQLWANFGYDSRGFVGYVLLVGSKSGKIVVDFKELADKLKKPEVAKNLEKYLLSSPENILNCYIAGGGRLGKWTEGLPISTDRNPIVPFVTDWSKGKRIHPSVLTQILDPEGPPVTNLPEYAEEYVSNFNIRYYYLGHLLRGELEGAMEKAKDTSLIERFAQERQRAIEYYRKVALSSFADSQILSSGLKIIRELGDMDTLREVVEGINKKQDKTDALLFEEALSYEAMGEKQKAILIYKKILSEKENVVPAMNNLSRLLAEKGKFKDALKLLYKSRVADPNHANTYMAIAEVKSMLFDFDSALDAIKKAKDLSPDDPRVFNLEGKILIQQGKFKEATASFKNAYRIDPFWDEPYLGCGIAYLQIKNFRRSIECLKTAVILNPKNSEIWLNLGFAFKGAGMIEDARVSFATALGLNPELKDEVLKEVQRMGKDESQKK